MAIDVNEIAERIAAQFKGDRRILYWEDVSRSYEDVVGELELDDVEVLNVEGQELASKRMALKERPNDKFVLYRPGEPPRAHDDFLYDIKVAATPFVCSVEGMWADECGISPYQASVLTDHARFFNSKERRERLTRSQLPKNTDEEIRFAMLAVCAKADADNWRDAARDVIRKVIVEYFEGKDSLYKLISESGLMGELWGTASKLLGYRVADGNQPSIDDLSYQMLLTQCAQVLSGNPQVLLPDAQRILDDIARNPKSKDAYEKLEAAHSQEIRSQLDPDYLNADALMELDALSYFDEVILLGFVESLNIGSLPSRQVNDAIFARQYSIWSSRYSEYYKCLLAAALFFENVKNYKETAAAYTTVKEIFDAYCAQYFEVDTQYRLFFASFDRLPKETVKQQLSQIRQRICAEYDDYLVNLTDRWQLHLCDENGVYPPASAYAQRDFFKREIEDSFPKAEKGKRIGVVISDALRYEVGVELAAEITKSRSAALRGKAKTEVAGALCMLPSYTQLGMAALLPDGPMEIDPSTEQVYKGGLPTLGSANREKAIDSRVQGALVRSAAEVLDSGVGNVSDCPLIYVYHNTIDKRGDSRDTEDQVFHACEEAIGEIERIAVELVNAGCGKILITADHGFLYQNHDIESHQFADIENLSTFSKIDGFDTSYSRRYIVSDKTMNDEMLIEYAAIDFSLEGDYNIILPKGVTRLRLRGSGARYVHGGASLQEDVIPIITMKMLKQGKASHQTGVQGFPTGRTSINGSSVSLQVYQTEGCSETVTPLTVKVGVYAPDESNKLLSTTEKIIDLASTSPNSSDRKTSVTLEVTNDIDDYSFAIVRISRQVNNTNQFASAWEETYSVSRAFGNDFDF